MFDFFGTKISLFMNENQDDNKVIVEDNNTLSSSCELLEVSFENNMVIITVTADCSIEEYSDYVDRCDDYIKKLFIPIRSLIYTRDDKSNLNITKQRIYAFKHNECDYLITVANNYIKISERNIDNDLIHETSIVFKKREDSYSISKYIHALNHSTKSCKWYKGDRNSFSLEKKDALFLARNTLVNLELYENIDSILPNMDRLYRILNIVSDKQYFPVASDDILSLSWKFRFYEVDINKQSYECLDIILNETKEIVGEISFDYCCSSGFSYGGNVGYEIYDEYQSNHYATRALGLLKELVKENCSTNDRDLYLATIPENIKSQRVILNNGGELVYEGSIPEDDIMYCINGVKNVHVYRIKIPNECL